MILYPSTISAIKYALLAFYQLFVFCAGIRMLMDDSYDGYVAPLSPTPPVIKPIILSKPRKHKHRISRSVSNEIILTVVRGGNSTS